MNVWLPPVSNGNKFDAFWTEFTATHPGANLADWDHAHCWVNCIEVGVLTVWNVFEHTIPFQIKKTANQTCVRELDWRQERITADHIANHHEVPLKTLKFRAK